MTKLNVEKKETRYVYSTSVCRKCGAKIFLMTDKHNFKCVLCRDEVREDGERE